LIRNDHTQDAAAITVGALTVCSHSQIQSNLLCAAVLPQAAAATSVPCTVDSSIELQMVIETSRMKDYKDIEDETIKISIHKKNKLFDNTPRL
jgi:hypothetical protein